MGLAGEDELDRPPGVQEQLLQALEVLDACIARIAAAAGATAKISSIHVNIWFGAWDKRSMARRVLSEWFGLDDAAAEARALFVGDSPNDAPMFAAFPLSVGVANVADFAGRIETPPAYVARARGGAGFAELAAAILSAR